MAVRSTRDLLAGDSTKIYARGSTASARSRQGVRETWGFTTAYCKAVKVMKAKPLPKAILLHSPAVARAANAAV